MTASKVLGYGIILGSVMGRSSCFLVLFLSGSNFPINNSTDNCHFGVKTC